MSSTDLKSRPLNKLDQPKAGRLNIAYSPDDDEIFENPPRFSWLPEIEDEARYCVRVSTDPKFKDALQFTDIPLNFFTPDQTFAPGKYYWSYAVWSEKQVSEWSTPRSFNVAEGLPETPLPARGKRFAKADLSHPRLWLNDKALSKFRKSVDADPTCYAWDVFLKKSVLPWMDRDIMKEPAGYPDHKRVAPIWRQTYIDCQELIYAIRHLAIGGHVTNDKAMLARAKEWLLEAASWNPAGVTSRAYTDEWAFRVNVALAWGYDWLYNELSDDERLVVRAALLERTRQTADHLIKHAKIHLFPYDSHAVRAVSAVLIPATIAMLDDEPEARDWLDYSIEFLSKVGYNLRQFAGVTGNGAYQWYHEEIKRNDPGTEMAFYNYGWWDLNFDEMMYLHDFGAVEAVPPADIPKLKWFKGIGWASIQHRMDDPNEHISFIMKSSPFGSVSHSHGDQNAFCMSAFGEDLAIQSGHYVAFNSSMHQSWRRQTRSKNAILIDGVGQYADKDKSKAMRSTGAITTAENRENHIFISGDATAAYASQNEAIQSVKRDVYFVHDSYFVIVDNIDASSPVEATWLLHANAPMQLGDTTFRYSGDKAGFYGQFLWSEAGMPTITQETGFPGVDESDYEGLPVSTCLHATFPKAAHHRIATLLVPYPTETPRRVFSFLDDQGYDCDLYFTDAQDRSFKIVVPKTFNVA